MTFTRCTWMVALALLALSEPVPARAQQASLTVALAAPMTGPLADAGKAMAAGAAMAARDINATGGVNGSKLELVIENDESGVAPARKVAEGLAARNIRYVIGHYTSAPTLSAAEIYLRRGMLLIAPSATSPRLTERAGAPVLRLAPLEDAQGRFAGEVLGRDFASGVIVIIRDGSAASRILAAAAQRALEAMGKQPAREIEITAGAPDGAALAAMQAQALSQAGASAIYWSGGASNVAAFLKALRAAGSRAAVIGNEALATPEFAAVAGDLADGIRVTVLAPSPPQAAKLVARLKSEGVRDVELALAAHASLQILHQAAARARSLEPNAIAKAARNRQPFMTVSGPVSFDEAGERVENLFTLAAWKAAADGKYVITPM